MVDYHTVLDDPVYPRPQTSVFLFAMNWDSYRALPADLQAVIDAHSGRNIARWAGEIWQAIEAPGEQAAVHCHCRLGPLGRRRNHHAGDGLAQGHVGDVGRLGLGLGDADGRWRPPQL